jgi:hypothetical protein
MILSPRWDKCIGFQFYNFSWSFKQHHFCMISTYVLEKRREDWNNEFLLVCAYNVYGRVHIVEMFFPQL